MDIKIITGLLTCAARGDQAQAIRDTYFPLLPHPFFFRGELGQTSRHEGDTIILDCQDTYEHLPRKIWRLYEYLLRHVSFDYFLKIDDDCYVNAQLLDQFFEHLRDEPPSLTHYMGSRILSPNIPRSITWHVGKVTSSAFQAPYTKTFNHQYCAGGSGYLLSRRAVEMIVERGKKHFLDETELYEDKCHGDVLCENGFLPTLMPAGIIFTDLSAAQIVALHDKPPTVKNKIYFGSGHNWLPGWSNFNKIGDLRKKLPFQQSSLRLLFAEHVVQQLTSAEAWRFFRECRRVLEPGGILRLVVPSVTRVAQQWTPAYLRSLRHSATGAKSAPDTALEAIFLDQNTKSIWSMETLNCALNSLGFETRVHPVNESDDPELRNLEKRGLTIGETFNRIESIAVEARAPTKRTLQKRSESCRIALLFLMRDNHHQTQMWHEYLERHEGEFSLYVHAKNRSRVTNLTWRSRLIPEHVATQWGNVSLVKATLALLGNAIQDPTNSHFVLLSESCVPIKPFEAFRRSLVDDPRGRMWLQSADQVNTYFPAKAKRLARAISVPRRHWFYHSQWIIFTREMAQRLLDEDRTSDFENVFASDECYFATVLAMNGFDLEKRVLNKNVTYTNWIKSSAKPSPHIFESLNGQDIEILKQSECFFARKFGPDSTIRGLGLHRFIE